MFAPAVAYYQHVPCLHSNQLSVGIPAGLEPAMRGPARGAAA
jgi:hypothetical protein